MTMKLNRISLGSILALSCLGLATVHGVLFGQDPFGGQSSVSTTNITQAPATPAVIEPLPGTATVTGLTGLTVATDTIAPGVAVPGGNPLFGQNPGLPRAYTIARSQSDHGLVKHIHDYQESKDEAVRKEATEKIMAIVSKQFDERQSQRSKELQQLEEQLAKLKATHQKREEQKERIVKDRVRQLLDNADGLGWGNAGDEPMFLRSQSSIGEWDSNYTIQTAPAVRYRTPNLPAAAAQPAMSVPKGAPVMVAPTPPAAPSSNPGVPAGTKL